MDLAALLDAALTEKVQPNTSEGRASFAQWEREAKERRERRFRQMGSAAAAEHTTADALLKRLPANVLQLWTSAKEQVAADQGEKACSDKAFQARQSLHHFHDHVEASVYQGALALVEE
ncbi:hypothetical protein [uncultured Xanthomonas sp.]|uniref:hypothetical protein n=1 Tax=uncultured Xanthomonas sp. TaxID=152831 RepID=UPI0037479C3E